MQKKRKTVVIDNPFNARNADRQNKHLFLLFLSPCMQPSKLTPLISWLASLIIWLFFYTALPFNFFMMFRQARKIAHHPTEQPCPITYTLQTKASFRYFLAKGIFASRGMNLRPNWQNFTATDWANILPTASADEVHRLSQMIIQRLNDK